MEFYSVAIDGPSGAGKSTFAKRIAEELGFLYVDTGAIYRTVGLYAQKNDVDPHDGPAVTALLDSIKIEMRYGDDGLQRMYLNGEDVTTDIRQHVISAYASAVSAIPQVREFLLEMQRNFARTNHVVMDGRDIGTVVLPNAKVKIYLTAEPEDRARRRYEELIQRGQDADYDTVLKDLIQRDYNDSHRATAPLRQAEDAILLDTTGNTLEQSYELIMRTIKERLDA